MASDEANHLSDRLLDEGLEPLDEALRTAGVPVSFDTGARWVRDGVHGVRLEAIRLEESGLCTSAAAVRRFVRARTDAEARVRAARGTRRRSRATKAGGETA